MMQNEGSTAAADVMGSEELIKALKDAEWVSLF